MAFTAKDVSALRERTGCGMMDCKKALTEANGDMDKAIEFLRERGLAAAQKKSGRIAAEGVVYALISEEKNAGCVIEVNSETDFVAKNDEFMKFVKNCAQAVLDYNPADVDALLECKSAGGLTVGDLLREKILQIGENIKVRRFARYEGPCVSYIHGGGRIGVLVKLEADEAVAKSAKFQEIGKDIAMQIAAANASYVCKEEVPEDVVAKEKEILTVQAINEGKPQAIAEKMVAGRISKFYKEVCLLEQPFIKDGELSVAKYIESQKAALGGGMKVVSFVRYERGEGLEKRQDNFAEEVAGMIK